MTPDPLPIAFLPAEGEAASIVRAFDWAASPLGPLEAWPQSLKTITGLMLRSPVPMVLLWGWDGYLIYNDGYSAFAGERHPGLFGRKVREAWPEIADFNDNVIRTVLGRGETMSLSDQELVLNRHGRLESAWMNLDYTPVMDDAGQPGGVLVLVVETTDRVMSQRRQQEASARQRQQLVQMPGFAAVLEGPDHVFTFVNDAYNAVAGGRPLMGLTMRDAFPELHDQGFFELIDRVYQTGERYVARAAPVRLTTQTDTAYLDFLYEPVRDDDGAVTGIFVGGYDVSDRVRNEAALRISEGRLRFLDDLARATSSLSDADAILGATTRMVGEYMGVSVCAYADMDDDEDGFTIRGDWAAPGSTSIVGHYSLAAFGTKAVRELGAGQPLIINNNRVELPPQEAATFQSIEITATICMPLIKSSRLTALMAIHDKDARRWTDDELALLREVTERSWAHIERVRAEAELRAREENFRTLARAMPNQAWTAQPDGLLDWFNDQVYGYSGAGPGTLDGNGWTMMVHPDDLGQAAERWARALASGQTYEVEFRLRAADGAWRWHITRAVAIKNAAGQVIRWVGTNTDIHDQKEAAALLEQRIAERTARLRETEEALRQSQKMEAVGQLTGGIAHDFNNLLAGISGSLELLEKRIGEGRLTGVDRYIEAAQTSAGRAAALTQRLLAFSRRQTLDPKALDVNRLIAGMEELVRRTVGPSIAVDVAAGAELWLTRVDPSQLENALLNLAINARDAMPDGGRITIETANAELSAAAASQIDLPPGQYVILSVADTGAGMSPEVANRAFDPFFTTKPLGQGTGLGLSMIHGFVRQSGGQVRIESVIGEGTTMRLYLPRFVGELAESEQAELTGRLEPGHDETVLVIDDEETIRLLVAEVLQEAGYRVLAAADGPGGLKILESDNRIDLLITDVGLPGGMNGRQVADAARVARPDLKVLFITGYAEQAAVGADLLDGGMQVITKPFALSALSARVREMIDG